MSSFQLTPPAPLAQTGTDAWDRALRAREANLGRVIRLELFTDKYEARMAAESWRQRAGRGQKPRAAKVYPRSIKVDGLSLDMHVLVVREKS
jgi:hypothetical protein